MEVKYITSEYVGKGHPDKFADLISDVVVGTLYEQDKNSRCGVETLVKDNHVVIGGEIKTNATALDVNTCVKEALDIVNYPKSHKELQFENMLIENYIGTQSREIDNGITNDDEIGAGDQGFVVGYASNETNEYLPLGVYLAKKIIIGLENSERWIGPDMKCQVIVKYVDGVASEIDSILVSTMHDESVSVNVVREYIIEFIKINRKLFDEKIFNRFIIPLPINKIIVNPCGDWNIGGPISDCGVTGRKIVVDQYGGYANVGGGSLAGKDMTKVDRSGAYMARYLAKNIVAANLCSSAKVTISYAIATPNPLSINVDMENAVVNSNDVAKWIIDNIDLSPNGIIKRFPVSKELFISTVVNGHFGVENYPWENFDIAYYLEQAFFGNRG